MGVKSACFLASLLVLAGCTGEEDASESVEPAASDSQEAAVSQAAAGYVTSANFEEKVFQSDLPVLVDFTATWCVPCREVDPIVEELMDEMAGRANVFKLDIDESPEIYKQLAVNGIPTVIFFNNGKEEERIKSPQSKEIYVQYMEAMIEGRSALEISFQLLDQDSFRRHFILSRKPDDVGNAISAHPGLLTSPFENGQTPLSLILNAPSIYQDAKLEIALSQDASVAPHDLVGLGRCEEFAAALAEAPQLVNHVDPDGNSVLMTAMSALASLGRPGMLAQGAEQWRRGQETKQERPLSQSAGLGWTTRPAERVAGAWTERGTGRHRRAQRVALGGALRSARQRPRAVGARPRSGNLDAQGRDGRRRRTSSAPAATVAWRRWRNAPTPTLRRSPNGCGR